MVYVTEHPDIDEYEAHDVVVACSHTDHPIRFATITDPSQEVCCGTCGQRMWRPVRRLEMPYSEVCMHMGIAGQTMLAAETASGLMVQLYDEQGRPFSFPITKGEAGWR